MSGHIDLPLDLGATRPILEQITNKWTLLILVVLCEQPSRFNGIERRLDGITHKALSDALKRLERNGLISRKVLPTQPIGLNTRSRRWERPAGATHEISCRCHTELADYPARSLSM